MRNIQKSLRQFAALLAVTLLLMTTVQCTNNASRQTRIIAHRGYWNTPNSAQNSISSVQNAVDAGIWGAEIDIHLTTDGHVVLFHDQTLNGERIDHCTYAQLQEHRLENGSQMPLLEDILPIITKGRGTKLIIEIKAHDTPEKEDAIVAKTLALVADAKAEKWVEYISFSAYACEAVIARSPNAKVAYLNGDMDPKTLKDKGYTGLDYQMNVLRDKHPEWIKQAQELGLTVNVWTVNKPEDRTYFLNAGVDFITTDNPTAPL